MSARHILDRGRRVRVNMVPRVERIIGVVAVVLGAICHYAEAQPVTTPPMVSGLWLVVTRPEMQGPLPPFPRTTRLCLSADDISAGRVSVPSMPVCRVLGGVWSGAQLALELTCPGLPEHAQVVGELQASGVLFTGKVTIVSQPDQVGAARGEFSYQQMGRWLAADCPTMPASAPSLAR